MAKRRWLGPYRLKMEKIGPYKITFYKDTEGKVQADIYFAGVSQDYVVGNTKASVMKVVRRKIRNWNFRQSREFQIFDMEYHSLGDYVDSDYYDSVRTYEEAKRMINKEGIDAVVYEYDKLRNRHRMVMSNWGGFTKEKGKWKKGKPSGGMM